MVPSALAEEDPVLCGATEQWLVALSYPQTCGDADPIPVRRDCFVYTLDPSYRFLSQVQVEERRKEAPELLKVLQPS